MLYRGLCSRSKEKTIVLQNSIQGLHSALNGNCAISASFEKLTMSVFSLRLCPEVWFQFLLLCVFRKHNVAVARSHPGLEKKCTACVWTLTEVAWKAMLACLLEIFIDASCTQGRHLWEDTKAFSLLLLSSHPSLGATLLLLGKNWRRQWNQVVKRRSKGTWRPFGILMFITSLSWKIDICYWWSGPDI